MAIEFKTYNQQLTILRKRGMIVPTNGTPKRFLEQENYYNVINGYKEIFLCKDEHGKDVIPEKYLPNTHFNELKALFLFDRELRFLFLKYLLIFENSFKTVISHEFTNNYPESNSYLEKSNYGNNQKVVSKQIDILQNTIDKNVVKNGAIKHYIEKYGSVPLWVLVNFLTIGNLSYLYSALKDSEKNNIAKYYSNKFTKQYKPTSKLKISSEDMSAALKIFILVRNQCAHDERLFSTDYKEVRIANIANYLGIDKCDNSHIVVAILYFRVFLNKAYYKKFHSELIRIFDGYKNKFKTISFTTILHIMVINLHELKKLV